MMDSEQVMRASRNMIGAAEQMSHAAANIEGNVHRLEQILTQAGYAFQEQVDRIEKIIESAKHKEET